MILKLETKRSLLLSRLKGLHSRHLLAIALFGLLSISAEADAPVLQVNAASLAASATDAIERAVDEAVRRYAESWPADGVVIEIPAGRWYLARPLRIDAKRSGRQKAPLVLRGQANGATILSGAVPLTTVENLPDELGQRLTAVAARNVRAFSNPEARTLLPALRDRQGQGLDIKTMGGEPFYPGQHLTLARWPNRDFATSGKLTDDKSRLHTGAVEGQWKAWTQATDAWAHGYWGRDWADEWIPVQAGEATPGTLILQGGPPKYGQRPGARFRVYNVLEELDEPGEWYGDAARGLLLVWPPAGADDSQLHLSSLVSVVEMRDASHVRLEHLVIEGARGDAVSVSGGRDVILANCLLRHAGLRGASLVGTAHQLVNSEIRDTGQGGAQLLGGDRLTLTPAAVRAEGNRFTNFNHWVRTYRPALLLGGVGNEAIGNLIEGGPHTAMMFYGNDHLIAENVLLRLATETGDVGAIYTGMDWTARGTVIRHNVLQDIRGPGLHGSRGVYLDDQASGITVQGNVFVRVDRAVFIGGGKDNQVDGNLFIASSPAIHLDDRGLTWQRDQTMAADGLLRRRLAAVPWRGPAYSRYPELAMLLEQDPGRPSGNIARRNAVHDSERLHFEGKAQSELLLDRFFGSDALRFPPGPSPSTRHFSQLELLPNSPAIREGFPLLPWARMRCAWSRWQGVLPGGAARDDLADCRNGAR